MAQKPGVPYADIRDKMLSYDLLLFRGGDMAANAIAKVEESYVGVNDFTHVGMVVRGRDLPLTSPLRNAGPARLYVFESTASGDWCDDSVPSAVDNRGHLGVQLRDLDLVVRSYDKPVHTRMAWMSLQSALRPRPDPLILQEELDKYMFRPYAASFVDLAAAASPAMRYLRDNWLFRKVRSGLCWMCCMSNPSTWLFCSELCAQIYKDVGVFPQTVVPADVMPVDFLPLETTPLLTPRSPEEPILGQTVDADHQVPWVYDGLVRFHADND